MELTEAQYERIAPLLPTQRGNVKLTNLQVLNGILKTGHEWRELQDVPNQETETSTVTAMLYAKEQGGQGHR